MNDPPILLVEPLDARLAPSVAAMLDGFGTLKIRTTGPDNVVVDVGAGAVHVNGSDPRNGRVTAAEVKAVRVVNGGEFDNFVDLRGVTGSAGFSGLDGNISVAGSRGDDTIYGSGFGDWLAGGGGDDELHGGDGNDMLIGGNGADYLAGNAGDDRLIGRIGDDVLMGGPGADRLTSGRGQNVVVQETVARLGFRLSTGELLAAGDEDTPSNEAISLSVVSVNFIEVGINEVVYSSDPSSPRFDARLRGATGASVASILVRGMDGNDTLSLGDGFAGANGRVTLEGGAGDDSLVGADDSDLVIGGDGNDTVTGGAGDDTLDGGAGENQIIESGDVRFVLSDSRLIGLGTDVVRHFAQAVLTGGPSDNLIAAFAFSGSVTLRGGAGEDVLYGGPQNDVLEGDDGNDYFDGGPGKDTILGGAGFDTLFQEAGPQEDVDVYDFGSDGGTGCTLNNNYRWPECYPGYE